jgi:hypothetical protein
MAASAVYVDVSRVPQGDARLDNHQEDNISTTTSAFELIGGLYHISAHFTGSGSVTLQKLGPDGSTYMTAATALSTTDTAVTASLPPGQYKVAIA